MELDLIKVIVFDLDGTLYEDTHHFDYYADRLQAKIAQNLQPQFRKDYEQALAEQHTLKIGRVYDVANDLIVYHLDQIVQAAYTWDGQEVSKERRDSLYREPIVMDMDTMLNIGDLWWVPGAIARHYGLTAERAQQAFLETRAFMMRPEFKMKKASGLAETLRQLRTDVKLVLLTNSPEPDSLAILEKLDLIDVFHTKIFNGKKPTNTYLHFQSIQHQFAVEYEHILSIGDNWINEIRPAKQLGCKTVFIDPHHLGKKGDADLIVKRIGDVVPILQGKSTSS